MYLPPAHLIAFDCAQILVEPLIIQQVMVVVSKIEIVLHDLMKSVSDHFPGERFGHNFVALVPVRLEG